MHKAAVSFADVVETVMTGDILDVYDGDFGVDTGPSMDESEGDNANQSTAKTEKKPRQNKSYVTAKTLNDREERRLLIKLTHYQKELKQATYQIDVAQRAIRRELQSINPDMMVDPNKGFFIPKGMTREQAELIKTKRLESQAASNTRSISLDEFTEMRRRKSEMGRQALQAIQELKPVDDDGGATTAVKGRDRWKALAGVLHSNPASFSQMAKVAAGKNNTSNGGSNSQPKQGQQQPPATAPADNTVRKVAKMATVVAALRGATR